MKNSKLIKMALIVVLLGLFSTSCGNSKDDEPENNENDQVTTIIGIWVYNGNNSWMGIKFEQQGTFKMNGPSDVGEYYEVLGDYKIEGDKLILFYDYDYGYDFDYKEVYTFAIPSNSTLTLQRLSVNDEPVVEEPRTFQRTSSYHYPF